MKVEMITREDLQELKAELLRSLNPFWAARVKAREKPG